MAQIPPFFADAGEVAKSRANFARMLGELDQWFDAAQERRRRQGRRLDAAVLPRVSAVDQSRTARPLRSAVRAVDGPVAEAARAGARGARGGPVRVGIASAQLRDHSVWNAIVKGWVRHLDKTRFELYLFNLGAKSDAETEQARAVGAPTGRRPARAAAMGDDDRRLRARRADLSRDRHGPAHGQAREHAPGAGAGRHLGSSGDDGPSDDRPLSVRRGARAAGRGGPLHRAAGRAAEPRRLLRAAGADDRGARPRRARPAAGRAAAVVPRHPVQVLAIARRGVDRDLPSRHPLPAGLLPAPGRRR